MGLTVGLMCIQGVPDFAGERCVLGGFRGVNFVGSISGLDEIKSEGEDGLDLLVLRAAAALALIMFVRARGPPTIPLSGGRPLARRPPPPLFNVTGPSSERHHGPSRYCKRSNKRSRVVTV